MSEFLPIVIINLKKRTDRWESICAHMDSISSGSNNNNNNNNNNNSTPLYYQRIDGVELKSPAKGCMQSHANAIQLAKENKWERVMVLEDDARLVNGWEQQWARIEQNLNKIGWKIVFGGTVRLKPRDVLLMTARDCDYFALRPGQFFTGTHCMIYHHSCYDEVIDLITNTIKTDDPFPIDMLLSERINSSDFTTNPTVFLSVPFLALFTENDVSDVRIGKDTSQDYDQLIESETLALRMMEQKHKFLFHLSPK